jgi:hypothetical protein
MRFGRNDPDFCSLPESGIRDIKTSLRSLLITGIQVTMLNALCIANIRVACYYA